jgi:hypothetical protein
MKAKTADTTPITTFDDRKSYIYRAQEFECAALMLV